MGKLSKYYSSTINIISVRYGEEDIRINIARESRINEDTIEEEIKKQPSSYAFLSMLHKRLLTKFELLKLSRKSLYGRLLAEAKKRTGPSGRPLSDNDAKAWVECHKKYIKASEGCIMARDKADQLFSAVRAFEQRAALLQTLSSNLRRER